MRPPALLALLCLLAAGCAAPGPGGPSAPSWTWFQDGIALERLGRVEAAKESYLLSLRADPGNVDARIALLRLEVPPPSPPSPSDGRLLAALSVGPAGERRKALEAVVADRPGHPAWRELGEVRLETGDASGAARAFEESTEIFDRDGRAHDGLARARFQDGDWAGALSAAEDAVRLDPGLVASQIFLAVDDLVDREYLDAIRRLENVTIRRPDRPLVGEERLVWWLAYDRALKRLAARGDVAVGAALAAEALPRFESAALQTHAAAFALAMGRPAEAARHVEAALRIDPFHHRAAPLARRLGFAAGRYLEALLPWERTVPLDWVLARDNVLGSRYRAIHDAARAGDRSRLAAACVEVGWFDEAEALGLELDEEARRFRRFLADLVAFTHRHDHDMETGRRTRSLDEFVEDVHALWGPGRPFDLRRDLETYYVVAEENDPFAAPEGSLGAYLARYAYFFDLSDAQGWVDFRVMHAVARRPFTAFSDGEEVRYEVLLSDETPAPSYDEFQWGELRRAGRAFLSRNGFYVSADALATSRTGLELLARLALDAPGEDDDEDSIYDPAAARVLARRVLGDFLEAGPTASWDEATWDAFARRVLAQRIENTARHELGHILDFRRLVPLSSHFLANLCIAISNGLSPDAIHTRFERAAETYAVGSSPHTAFALLDNLERLEIDRTSLSYLIRIAWTGEPPEDSPYYEGAEDLFRELAERSGIPDGGNVARWVAEIPEETVRRIALEMAADEGIR